LIFFLKKKNRVEEIAKARDISIVKRVFVLLLSFSVFFVD